MQSSWGGTARHHLQIAFQDSATHNSRLAERSSPKPAALVLFSFRFVWSLYGSLGGAKIHSSFDFCLKNLSGRQSGGGRSCFYIFCKRLRFLSCYGTSIATEHLMNERRRGKRGFQQFVLNLHRFPFLSVGKCKLMSLAYTILQWSKREKACADADGIRTERDKKLNELLSHWHCDSIPSEY